MRLLAIKDSPSVTISGILTINTMAQEKIYIYGKHALVEALTNTPKAVEKIFLSPQSADGEIQSLAQSAKVPTETFLPKTVLPGVDKDAVHQGVIAQIVVESLMRPYRDFAENLTVTPSTMLVLLGEIQDPQNVGAIIRSAAAFGAAGVLIPEHNQAQVTGLVVKISAGMAFRVPLVTIGNVNTTIRDLKERGFWVYGMDETATHPLNKEIFDAPTLFIPGNEGTGLREHTRELCDILVSVPMSPKCESLNVAASTAVTLYAWSSQHPESLS